MGRHLLTSRWQRFIGSKATRLVVVTVALLAAAEVICRYGMPTQQGLVMAPHISLLWASSDSDPCTPRLPQRTGNGGPRGILFLGDSILYGTGVLPAETFPRQVEARANGHLHTANCGVPGYSTFQSLNALELSLPEQEPDLLVIANLWSDCNFDTFVDKDLLAKREQLSFRILFTLGQWLSRSSLRQMLLRVTGQTNTTSVGWGNRRTGQISGQRRVSINDYATNLDAMVDRAESVGAEVLFLILANEEDVGDAQRIWPWQPYREVMRDVAANRGYPVVSVPEVFRATGLERAALFFDEMHPSVLGHRLIADAILAELVARNWSTGGSLRTTTDNAPPLPFRPDPLVSSTLSRNAPATPYSIAGVLLMKPDAWSDPDSTDEAKARYRIDAVAKTDNVTVVTDEVIVPGAAPFVLTVTPPQAIALRLTTGTLRQGTYEWQAPRVLTGGSLDLKAGPVWGLTVGVDEGYVRRDPGLPGNWEHLLEGVLPHP